MCVNVVQRQAAVALYALMKEKWRGFGGMLGGKKGKHPNGHELMEARASLDYKLEYICTCLCERDR